jgi:hypothetical protein
VNGLYAFSFFFPTFFFSLACSVQLTLNRDSLCDCTGRQPCRISGGVCGACVAGKARVAGSDDNDIEYSCASEGAPSSLAYAQSVVIVVVGQPMAPIAPSVTPASTLGLTYAIAAATSTSSSSSTPVSFEVATGLSFNAADGTISGTPTVIGGGGDATTTFTVTASNSAGSAAARITVQVNDVAPAAPAFAADDVAALTVLTLGDTVAVFVTAGSGGASDNAGAATSYAIEPTTLTALTGLVFDATTGGIGGTATRAVDATEFVVSAVNSGGSTSTTVVGEYSCSISVSFFVVSYSRHIQLTIVYYAHFYHTAVAVEDVLRAPVDFVYSRQSGSYAVGTPIVPISPSSGGGAATSYTIQPPTLTQTTGLLFNFKTGVISGTPAGALNAIALYTVTATNNEGSAIVPIAITLTAAGAVEAVTGIAYASTSVTYVAAAAAAVTRPTVAGGAPTAFAITPSLTTAMPGLVFSTVDGSISGTPTAAAVATPFTVTASNALTSVSTTLRIGVVNASGAIIVTSSGALTTASGGVVTLTVILDSAPTADVTVAVSSLSVSAGAASPSSLVFTPLAWAQPQTVTITGAACALTGTCPSTSVDVVYTVAVAPASSSDARFNAVIASPSSVQLINRSGGGGGISGDAFVIWTPVTATYVVSGALTLATRRVDTAAAAAFDVTLSKAPTSLVSVAVSSSNSSEGVVAVTDTDAASLSPTLYFNAFNWDVPQRVTVSGVGGVVGGVGGGDVAYAVSLGPVRSTDAAFNAAATAVVPLVNSDSGSGIGGDAITGGGGGGTIIDGGGGGGGGSGSDDGGGSGGVVAAVIVVLLLVAAAGVAYWKRVPLLAWWQKSSLFAWWEKKQQERTNGASANNNGSKKDGKDGDESVKGKYAGVVQQQPVVPPQPPIDIESGLALMAPPPLPPPLKFSATEQTPLQPPLPPPTPPKPPPRSASKQKQLPKRPKAKTPSPIKMGGVKAASPGDADSFYDDSDDSFLDDSYDEEV